MSEGFYYSIHNLERYTCRNLYCYLPENASSSLKCDIKVALAKNFMRYKSLDHVKKRMNDYITPDAVNNNYQELLREIENTIWRVKNQFKDKLDKLTLKDQNVITLGLTSTFMRLENSYESILFLINNQFFFESITINRLIFEQLNYCFNLAQFTPKEFENLTQNQIKKDLSVTNIKRLKNFLPNSGIGKFYSDLSELAHIDVKRINEYLEFSDDVKDNVITMKSIHQSIISAIFLLKNIEIHGVVFEYCFNKLADIKLTYLQDNGGELVLNQERETKTLYNEYVKRFIKLVKEIKVPVQFMNKSESLKDKTKNLPF